MSTRDERIEYAVSHTEILRPPKQSLATFGTTNIHYYLVTEPSYTEFTRRNDETVIREGRVIAERPRIVTPYYLSRLDGFSSEAKKYFSSLIGTYGPDAPGLFYTYRNEPKQLNIVADRLWVVADRLNTEIEKRGDPLTSIIKGEDELWDVSLMKFIYEVARNSVQDNLSQLNARGLLKIDSGGVPADARIRIEAMFGRAIKGEYDSRELKSELDRWDLFAEYEDRFFALFKK